MHWLEHFLGMDMSGDPYGFWSGFGSDLSELAIFGALLAMVRKHNCHVHGCWRIGRFPVDGTTWTVCRRHHPDDPPRAHHLHRDERPAP
jgi:hypothetical protein